MSHPVTNAAAAVLPPLLSGKIALVTGAGHGIGRAIALRYAQEGAKVVLSDTNDCAGRQTFEQLRSSGGEGIFVHARAQCAQHHRMLVQAAADAYGQLDIACNNTRVGSLDETIGGQSALHSHDDVDLELSCLFSNVRVQLEAMLSKGGGVIVNVASIRNGAVSVGDDALLYTAAKLVSLTKIAAGEYGSRGIRVNTVGPVFIASPLLPGTLAHARTNCLNRRVDGSQEQAEELVALIAWLSSDRSTFVTGAYYPIDPN